jgi:hypothetical protein
MPGIEVGSRARSGVELVPTADQPLEERESPTVGFLDRNYIGKSSDERFSMIIGIQDDHWHYSVNSSCSMLPVDQRPTTGAAHAAPGAQNEANELTVAQNMSGFPPRLG